MAKRRNAFGDEYTGTTETHVFQRTRAGQIVKSADPPHRKQTAKSIEREVAFSAANAWWQALDQAAIEDYDALFSLSSYYVDIKERSAARQAACSIQTKKPALEYELDFDNADGIPYNWRAATDFTVNLPAGIDHPEGSYLFRLMQADFNQVAPKTLWKDFNLRSPPSAAVRGLARLLHDDIADVRLYALDLPAQVVGETQTARLLHTHINDQERVSGHLPDLYTIPYYNACQYLACYQCSVTDMGGYGKLNMLTYSSGRVRGRSFTEPSAFEATFTFKFEVNEYNIITLGVWSVPDYMTGNVKSCAGARACGGTTYHWVKVSQAGAEVLLYNAVALNAWYFLRVRWNYPTAGKNLWQLYSSNGTLLASATLNYSNTSAITWPHHPVIAFERYGSNNKHFLFGSPAVIAHGVDDMSLSAPQQVVVPRKVSWSHPCIWKIVRDKGLPSESTTMVNELGAVELVTSGTFNIDSSVTIALITHAGIEFNVDV